MLPSLQATFGSEHNEIFSVLQYTTARVSWSVPVLYVFSLNWSGLIY